MTLKSKGKSTREISRLLGISKNTVKRVIREGSFEKKRVVLETQIKSDIGKLLPDLFKRCNGNAVRIQEILMDEYQQNIPYSTLTLWCRDYSLRGSKVRVGQYHHEAGDEMHHDTSPHKVLIGEKECVAQCASLTLAYSRRIFIQYYPRFTRFEAKIFLSDAFEFMDGVCRRCVIDNTSVILSSGAGKYAVTSPEMSSLCRMYHFEFMAHAVMDPDRKARVERPFHYIENNFLVGRTFTSWDDLNTQAVEWCKNKSNQKIKRELGMSPEQAYLQEKSALIALPDYRPPIYKLETRIVDTEAYIHIETNHYPVSEKFIGKTVDVYRYKDRIEINFNGTIIATHTLLIGVRHKRAPSDGYHLPLHKKRTRGEISDAENLLRNQNDILDKYISELKKHVRGRGTRTLQQLLNLKRTYPKDAFALAIKQAAHYRLYDMRRLEKIILSFVSNEFFNLGEE